MTPRERVIKAFNHEQPDITPWHITFTIPARRRLEEYLGNDNLDPVLGNHFAKIEAVAGDAWREIRPDYWQDEFGVVWDRTIDKDIGNVDHSALVLPEPDLGGLKFPDPFEQKRWAGFDSFGVNNPDLFRVNDFGFTLFERAWTLRGLENFLIDMVENPAFAHRLLDTILDWNLKIIQGVARYNIDAILFGDDWGQQHGLIMGPEMWREFIKPRAAAEYRACKAAGMHVMIHSCGDVSGIMGELADIGVEVFNPFQPEVMDIVEIKRNHGDRMSFFGGMSTQRTLPSATPEQVREKTRWLCDMIGNGGGYVFSPAHDIPGDVPAENMLAMIEELKKQ